MTPHAEGGRAQSQATPETSPSPHHLLHGVCYNAGGSLGAKGSDAAASLGAYMVLHDLDTALLSDPGRVLPSAKRALKSQGYDIFCSDPGPHGRTVAVVVRSSLVVVGEPLRDSSGGALALDVELSSSFNRDSSSGTRSCSTDKIKPNHGGATDRATGTARRCVARLIAVYQPPNLDGVELSKLHPFPPKMASAASRAKGTSGTLTGPALRNEAERVAQVITRWANGRGIVITVAGGDYNETVTPADRITADRHTGVYRRPKMRFGPVHQMISHGCFADLYRLVKPLPDGGDECEDHQIDGHSFFHHRGSSRIVFPLVFPHPSPEEVAVSDCFTDNSFELGKDTGHRPVRFRVVVPSAPSKASPGRRWTGPNVNTKDLAPDDKNRLMRELNAAVALKANRWRAVLLHTEASGANAEHKVAAVIRGLSRTLLDTGKHTVGGKTVGTRQRYQPSAGLTKAKAVRRHFCTLRNAIRRSRDLGFPNNTAFSHEAAKAAALLEGLGGAHLLGAVSGVPWSDTDSWTRWESNCTSTIKAIRLEIRAQVRKDTRHPSNVQDKLLSSAKGRGRFYREYIRGTDPEGSAIRSCKDSAGVLQTEPSIYIPQVRKHVAAPFSNPKPGPAVPTWRDLTEEERRTGTPHWWDAHYSRDAKGIHSDTWDGLMACTNREELWALLRGAEGEKAPGHDGVGIDLLKIGIGTFMEHAPEECALLSVLVCLVNTILQTGCCPAFSKEGIIVMIPKPGARSDVCDMRPITLLPELGKLPSRLLASRFLSILHSHPNILDKAQRAYLHDGSSRQCLSTVLDMCEDFKERCKKEGIEFVITSYDVKKAFDSVQLYSVAASCKRFNLPDVFIDYTVNTLRGATSRVRTYHGLSDPIDILTSVRQGDPMAAIIFNLMMDSLHAGFRSNPLYSSPTRGYTLGGPDQVEIFSAGYADDTAAVAPSWNDAVRQHMWLLDFFVAHHLRLNPEKSYCIVGSGTLVSSADPSRPTPRSLPNIDDNLIHDPLGGKPATPEQLTSPTPLVSPDIIARPPTYAFRYLGLMLRVDLDPSDMKGVLSGRVWDALTKIRLYQLDLVQAGDFIREYVYPRLELGMVFYDFGADVLDTWESLLRRAVLRWTLGCNVAAINKAAFWLSLGLQPPREFAMMVRIVDLGNTLRSTLPDSACTGWSRVTSAVRNRKIKLTTITAGGRTLKIAHSATKCALNRMSSIVKQAIGLGIHISWLPPHRRGGIEGRMAESCPKFDYHGIPQMDSRVGCPILPSVCTHEALRTVNKPACGPWGEVAAFTDGSYAKSNAGFAAVLCDAGAMHSPGFVFSNCTSRILKGESPSSGRNYTAECMAILAALHAVPLDAPLTVYTDALSAIQAIERPLLSESARIRMGARPVIKTIRRFIENRSARTSLVHVRSHTGSEDVISRGNASADEHAGDVTGSSAPHYDQNTPFLTNEERAIFWEAKCTDPWDETIELQYRLWHVSGDLRTLLKSKIADLLMERWSKCRSQGHVARKNGPGLARQLNTVRKLRDNGLQLFLLKVSTCQTDTADRCVWPRDARTPEALVCPRCGDSQQCTLHCFTCSRMRAAWDAPRKRTSELLEQHCLPTLDSQKTAPFLKDLVRAMPASLRWYDPTRPPRPTGFLGEDCADGAIRKSLAKIEAYDRLTGSLGILPPELPGLLRPDPASLGAHERHHKILHQRARANLCELSLSILRNTRAIYEAWRPAFAERPPISRRRRRPPRRSAPITKKQKLVDYCPSPASTKRPAAPAPRARKPVVYYHPPSASTRRMGQQ